MKAVQDQNQARKHSHIYPKQERLVYNTQTCKKKSRDVNILGVCLSDFATNLYRSVTLTLYPTTIADYLFIFSGCEKIFAYAHCSTL